MGIENFKRNFSFRGGQALLCTFVFFFLCDFAFAQLPEAPDNTGSVKSNEVDVVREGVTEDDSGQSTGNVTLDTPKVITEYDSGADKLTLSWEAVSNATGYVVIYMGESNVVSNCKTEINKPKHGKKIQVIAKSEKYVSVPWEYTIDLNNNNKLVVGSLFVIIICVILYYFLKRKRQKVCRVCGSLLDINNICTNPFCISLLPKCDKCGSILDSNGKCPECYQPPKQICDFCKKEITFEHQQDLLCPSNWEDKDIVKLRAGSILINKKSISKGGQGEIFPVWIQQSSKQWVFKRFHNEKDYTIEYGTLKSLGDLDCVPIVFSQYSMDGKPGFIMTKAAGCDLNLVFGLKTNQIKVSKAKTIIFIKKLCSAIQYLHLNGISHRDLKPVNIFYDLEAQKITIIDFGTAVGENTKNGSKAPMGDAYKCESDHGNDFESGKQRDIYSIGVLIKEIWAHNKFNRDEILEILNVTCDINQNNRVTIMQLNELINSRLRSKR